MNDQLAIEFGTWLFRKNIVKMRDGWYYYIPSQMHHIYTTEKLFKIFKLETRK